MPAAEGGNGDAGIGGAGAVAEERQTEEEAKLPGNRSLLVGSELDQQRGETAQQGRTIRAPVSHQVGAPEGEREALLRALSASGPLSIKKQMIILLFFIIANAKPVPRALSFDTCSH